ncbi:hypothetical protein [Ensifer sp. NM-2]|uniref:hypothetical protein n=1 Tax=Ensifer sp. NM-2 TaxID=2109730 RepID=UPI0011B2569E|nr:hypothetical protein [Ensifer sp. NM-2]
MQTSHTANGVRRFTRAEIKYLHSAGFEIEHRAILASPFRSEERRGFVLAHARDLAGAGFRPQRILHVADMRPRQCSFILGNLNMLRNAGFKPRHIHRLARKIPAVRNDCLELCANPEYELYSPSELIAEAVQYAEQRARDRRLPPPHSPSSMARPLELTPRNLSEDESRNIADAFDRWGEKGVPHNEALRFFHAVVSAEAAGAIAGNPNLILMIAGLAHVADNKDPSNRDRHRERVKQVTDYLAATEEADLVKRCEEEAHRHVGFCGDGLAAAMAQIETVIWCDRLNDRDPVSLFDDAKCIFSQQRMETWIAGRYPNSGELNEYFLDMSKKLRAMGFKLIDSTETTSYGHLFNVDDEAVEEFAVELAQDLAEPTETYVGFLSEIPAVRSTIEQIFCLDFSSIEHGREETMEQIMNTMDEGGEGADTAYELSNTLPGMLEFWYREKIKKVLRDPSLLNAEDNI